MGTPDFAVPALEALIKKGHEIVGVVSQPDRPKGRGRKPAPPPVKVSASSNGIEVLQPEDIQAPAFISRLREMAPDLIIVVAFGKILKESLLTLPRWGVINIHASLLPRYRGASPIQSSILNDESWTGLTLMGMDKGMDTGPILFQKAIAILRDETFGQLHDRLSLEAGEFLLESLEQMRSTRVREIPQDHSRATYAPKIGKEMSPVKWDLPATKVSAHIRALDPWPGAVSELDGKKIKLFSSRCTETKKNHLTPGRIITREGNFKVEAGDGVVEVREVQYPGKKRLPASDFLRGFTIPEGAILSSPPKVEAE
jgi:methionyl-tRNA formyltransferase